MTASRVVFDTWAWWEVLQGTPEGARLKRRYLDASGALVLTSAISLGEISAKLSSQGLEGSIPVTVTSIRQASLVEDVTGELAVEAGVLRSSLRRKTRSASLADGIVLATARKYGAKVISIDSAFSGQPDVGGA